jgi:hypothetical protein
MTHTVASSLSLHYPRVLAEVYGSDTYGGSSYGGESSTNPLSPNTGFFEQPPIIVFPTLLVGAVLLGTLSFLIARKLRQRRK